MIEQELKRIADSLEILVELAQNPAKIVEPVKKSKKKKEQPAEPLPSAPLSEDIPPAEPSTPPGIEASAPSVTITTTEQLRELAQSYLTKLGPNNTAFVAFIQQLCKDLSPANPRLMAVPLDKIPTAVQLIKDWGTRNNIAI